MGVLDNPPFRCIIEQKSAHLSCNVLDATKLEILALAFTITCKTGTLIIIHQVTLLVLFVFILIISTIFVVTTATLTLLWL